MALHENHVRVHGCFQEASGWILFFAMRHMTTIFYTVL